MSREDETTMSDCRQVVLMEAPMRPSVTTEEVLLWEAT